MSIRVVSLGLTSTDLALHGDRNASIADSIEIFGKVRSFQRGREVRDSTAVRLGRALRRNGVPVASVRRSTMGVLVEDTADLRSTMFDEAIWFFKVGALHLHHASDSAYRGRPTAGVEGAYYASYYFAQCLCRLAGRVPLYLREFETARPGPNVLLAWDGETPARRYSVSGYLIGGRPGTHRALWNVFFKIFENCPNARSRHIRAVQWQDNVAEEVNHRNDITYVPWLGYAESASAEALAQAREDYRSRDDNVSSAIQSDPLGTLAQLATDPEFGPYAKACLRGSLAITFMEGLAAASEAIGQYWVTVKDDVRDQLNYLGDLDASSRFLESSLA